MKPLVEAFFDPATFTYSYVVANPQTGAAAVIDSVLDYDAASGRTSTDSADRIVEYIERSKFRVEWILETHIHADHLSGAAYLQSRVGGRTGIGARVVEVQSQFGDYFNADCRFDRDGSQFDRLFDDGETFQIGELLATVWFTPGHTPACATYLFDGAAFVGDTLFMPDYGTARTDFPGGSARTLYRSIHRILELPPETTLYLCHDYGTDERTEFENETTVAEQRNTNKFIHVGVDEDTFVRDRERRDSALATPKLLMPSVQFNMRGGEPPPAEDNGVRYFKIPITVA